MKHLLLIALISVTYYAYTNQSPFQTEVTDPHYIEIRVPFENSNIKLVGFGKMFSHGDCLARSAIFWKGVFKNAGEVKVSATESDCKKSIPKRYRKLFDDKPVSASYLVMNKGNNLERDARFVFYGIPSSVVAKECDKLISQIKNNYSGKMYCVKGMVG